MSLGPINNVSVLVSAPGTHTDTSAARWGAISKFTVITKNYQDTALNKVVTAICNVFRSLFGFDQLVCVTVRDAVNNAPIQSESKNALVLKRETVLNRVVIAICNVFRSLFGFDKLVCVTRGDTVDNGNRSQYNFKNALVLKGEFEKVVSAAAEALRAAESSSRKGSVDNDPNDDVAPASPQYAKAGLRLAAIFGCEPAVSKKELLAGERLARLFPQEVQE